MATQSWTHLEWCLHDHSCTLGLNAKQKGLTHICSPHPAIPTAWLESMTKFELEQLCWAKAGCCFMQATDTPFLQPLLLQAFTEYNIYTQAFDNCIPMSSSKHDLMAQQVLQALKMTTHHSNDPKMTPWQYHSRMAEGKGSHIFFSIRTHSIVDSPRNLELWPSQH